MAETTNETTDVKTATLLPCPFCGDKPYFTRTKNGTQMAKVGCSHCGIEIKCAVLGYGEDAPMSKDIFAAWNTRAQLASLKASPAGEGILEEIEKLRKRQDEWKKPTRGKITASAIEAYEIANACALLLFSDRLRLALSREDGLRDAEGLLIVGLAKEIALDKALMLACRRIADGPQEYHEANTAEGWREAFIKQAALASPSSSAGEGGKAAP